MICTTVVWVMLTFPCRFCANPSRKPKSSSPHKKQRGITVGGTLLQQPSKSGGAAWQRQIAALTIQLAWRQYARRKLSRRRSRDRVLHQWSPRLAFASRDTTLTILYSVMAVAQKTRMTKVYSKPQKSKSYRPRGTSKVVMSRPEATRYRASPAGE